MSTTTVRISGEGEQSQATADVQHYSPGRRYGLGITFLVLGLGAAGAALLVPTPHIFCTTWLFPLLGAFACYMTIKTEVRVSDIKGPCPACKVDIRLVGGTSETIEISCPKCFKPLTVDAKPGSSPTSDS